MQNAPGRKYDYAVYIGRFQPLHEGHLSVLRKAYEVADKVIVLCGSANRPRTVKNPWTVAERHRMISLAVGEDRANRTLVRGIDDYLYNDDKWLLGVQTAVDNIVYNGVVQKPKVCLIGYKKDHSTYYLDMFPQWDQVMVAQDGILNATDVRDFIFATGDLSNSHAKVLPKPVANFVTDWIGSDASFKQLQGEFSFLQTHNAKFRFYPYPEALNMTTVDAIVVESGHLLLIARGKEYGYGQLALPGGFLNNNETIQDAMLRELREETNLHIAPKILKGSLQSVRVFDHPDRSMRGRIVTHAHHVVLPPCPTGGMSPVKAGDDAMKGSAKWVPLIEVQRMRNNFFEDHYDIISETLGI